MTYHITKKNIAFIIIICFQFFGMLNEFLK
jgi:hypothetical protein